MKDRALIVFARSPRAGHVKSRLTTLITPQEAADLYRAFLMDSLQQYASLNIAVRLYMSDEGAPHVPVFGATLKRQHGDDLGQRMQHAFQETAKAGYKQIIIIGSDHPTLPLVFLQRAFEVLSEAPTICIGPTEDGGYYLLGMNPLIHGLFDGIVYSRPDVFSLTRARAYQTGANIIELPKWYDVDTPADLRRLTREESIPVNTLNILKQLNIWDT